MNYLTFDPNIQNAFISIGISNICCNSTDYSIFHLKDKADNFLSLLEFPPYSDSVDMKNSFYRTPLTILYSYCPLEICGLYATIFHHPTKNPMRISLVTVIILLTKFSLKYLIKNDYPTLENETYAILGDSY